MDHDAANMAGVEIAEHLIEIHDDQRCDCGVTMSYYCIICRKKCCMDCTNRHSDYGKHMLIQVFRGIYDCIAIKYKDCERMWMGNIKTQKYNMVRLVRKHLGCECGFLGHRPAYCSIQCFFERNCLTVDDDLMPLVASLQPLVKVSKDEFEKLPPFMRTVVSWEELVEGVEKINMRLRKKEKTTSGEGIRFFEDEIPSLSLGGAKARCTLILLECMKQLVVERVDGLTSYRVLQSTSENH